MADDNAIVQELRAMQDRVRLIRTQCCESKSSANPRYLALKAMADIEDDS